MSYCLLRCCIMKFLLFFFIGLFASFGTYSQKILLPKKIEELNFCRQKKFDLYRYFDKRRITRFSTEIAAFRREDSVFGYEQKSILFVGSSSIRKWKQISADFSGLKILQRGFGGSTYPELIYYYNDLILKYKPRIIVIYEGDNDQYFMTPEEIAYYACYLVKKIRSTLPITKILLMSVKPSPARRDKLKSMMSTNIFLQEIAAKYDNVEYIDIWSSMFEGKARIRKDIWKADSLHMNAKGYRLWQKKIDPFLK